MEEPTFIRKQTGNYNVVTTYVDEKNQSKQVTVILIINFHLKTYDIHPENGGQAGFKFIQTSHQWQKWQAVTVSIQKAIEFANQEIKAIEDKEFKP